MPGESNKKYGGLDPEYVNSRTEKIKEFYNTTWLELVEKGWKGHLVRSGQVHYNDPKGKPYRSIKGILEHLEKERIITTNKKKRKSDQNSVQKNKRTRANPKKTHHEDNIGKRTGKSTQSKAKKTNKNNHKKIRNEETLNNNEQKKEGKKWLVTPDSKIKREDFDTYPRDFKGSSLIFCVESTDRDMLCRGKKVKQRAEENQATDRDEVKQNSSTVSGYGSEDQSKDEDPSCDVLNNDVGLLPMGVESTTQDSTHIVLNKEVEISPNNETTGEKEGDQFKLRKTSPEDKDSLSRVSGLNTGLQEDEPKDKDFSSIEMNTEVEEHVKDKNPTSLELNTAAPDDERKNSSKDRVNETSLTSLLSELGLPKDISSDDGMIEWMRKAALEHHRKQSNQKYQEEIKEGCLQNKNNNQKNNSNNENNFLLSSTLSSNNFNDNSICSSSSKKIIKKNNIVSPLPKNKNGNDDEEITIIGTVNKPSKTVWDRAFKANQKISKRKKGKKMSKKEIRVMKHAQKVGKYMVKNDSEERKKRDIILMSIDDDSSSLELRNAYVDTVYSGSELDESDTSDEEKEK